MGVDDNVHTALCCVCLGSYEDDAVSRCNANARDGFMRIVWTLRTSELMGDCVLYVDFITTNSQLFWLFHYFLSLVKKRKKEYYKKYGNFLLLEYRS